MRILDVFVAEDVRPSVCMETNGFHYLPANQVLQETTYRSEIGGQQLVGPEAEARQ